MNNRIHFFNCCFDNVYISDVLETIDVHVSNRDPGYMCSVNTDIVVQLDRDEAFKAAFESADLVLMDSEPLRKVLMRQGIPVKEKLSGSDLMPIVCDYAAKNGYNCFILGGAEGVPQTACEKLIERYPGLKIEGYSPKYGFYNDSDSIQAVIDLVRSIRPDIMFICLGSPRSEKLIHERLYEFDVPFSLSVGAAVDFAAGNVKRAPVWMQKAGLEWFYRFLQEPKRMFRRYFIDSWSLVSIARRSKEQK